MSKKGMYINDNIHGLISFSEYEKRIISSVGFNRLHDVYQNSTVYLTFPSNRTKRFEHSIGTMKLCSDMFFHSILNASPKSLEDFYQIFKNEFNNILEEIKADAILLNHYIGDEPKQPPVIEYDKISHSLIPNNVAQEYKDLHFILIQSIRVAALLHDIGHPPFSHVIENALNQVYDTILQIDPSKITASQSEFMKTTERYFRDGKKLHEGMGEEISQDILISIIPPRNNNDDDDNRNAYLEVFIMMIVKKMYQDIPPFSYLHNIIDGSIDGDRLDYVTRDSFNSGMNNGRIDYSRIINEMQMIVQDKKIFFCTPLKAVNSVEDFFKRRFNVFKDIIHHHRVIKTDSLLEYAVRDLILSHINTSNEELPNSSPHPLIIPQDLSGLWSLLNYRVKTDKLNSLSQWNDSWLMTLLKQIYFSKYHKKKFQKEYVLQQRLSELLRNNKNYHSVIKRSEHFKSVDDRVKEVLRQSREQIDELVNKVRMQSNSIDDRSSSQVTLEINPTLSFIHRIFHNDNENTIKGFILSYISRHSSAIGIDFFQNFIREIIQNVTKNTFKNTKLYDTMVVFKERTLGLDPELLLCDYNDKTYKLKDVSGIADLLLIDIDYLPLFYVYILVKNGEEIVPKLRDELLLNIGDAIGRELMSVIKKRLDEQIMCNRQTIEKG